MDVRRAWGSLDKQASVQKFEFSTEIIQKVIDELDKAEKFIKIAIFQIHHIDVFNILNKKLSQNVKIEIFTLPYDSIYENIRPQVESEFKKLESNGTIIHFCKWNVGDPSRTTTAVGRWYSFHGKFIVTDKSAIALSANLIQAPELDSMIVYSNDDTKIAEFNNKFDMLVSLFVTEKNGFDGSIRSKIIEEIGDSDLSLFGLPENVDEIYEYNWIRHYPDSLCPTISAISEGLYITPFDCKGRDFITKVINEASEYAYLSTESFTDIEFSNFLVNTAVNKNLDIRLITGIGSMDFTDRVNNMLRDLLAQEIKIKTTEEALHSKLIITDKYLIVSSINLNKINLGFNVTKRYWRENTESIFVSENPEIIEEAKARYIEVYDASKDVREKLAQKTEKIVKNIFSKTFGLRSSSAVKSLFSKLILNKQISVRVLTTKIGKITKRLMTLYRRNMVRKDDFVSALILYYLTEEKHDYDQIKEKLDELDRDIDIETILSGLTSLNLIEKENKYYKINLEALLEDRSLNKFI